MKPFASESVFWKSLLLNLLMILQYNLWLERHHGA